MPALELGALVNATGGNLLAGSSDSIVRGASIDTRSLVPGSAFFALKGTRTDGHVFLPDAARAGAVAAFVERAPDLSRSHPPAVVQVDDVASALARCAELARRTLRAKVIALTGSTGKTTTKELLAAGLARRLRVHRTPANLNNELGVPLTMLGCPDDAEAVVVELGLRKPGDIYPLARIVDPDVGLVTNVRPVHLEFFSSVDDIAANKGELYAVLRRDAVSVVNLDDELCVLQSARHAGPRVTFGSDPRSDLILESIEDRFDPGAVLRFRHGDRSHQLQLSIGGCHAARNALAALAAVRAAGGAIEDVLEGMARVEPAPGRGRIHRLSDGIVLVDDTYNANPAAVASVLATLRSSSCSGRRVFVLGDMLELGPLGPSFHRTAGQQTAAAGVHLLIGVGSLIQHTLEAARRAGVPEVRHEADAHAASRNVPALLRPNDLVVVKGSRGVRLDEVVQAVLRQREGVA